MKTWLKVFLGLAVTGIIAAILVYVFVYNKSHPDYETLKADFTVTAQQLFDEFKADNVTAGQKYNGKMVEISGPLTRMEISDSLTTAIFVFQQGDFGDEGVRCSMLPKFTGTAQHLQAGNLVTIKGYCTGFTGDVVMEQCSIRE